MSFALLFHWLFLLAAFLVKAALLMVGFGLCVVLVGLFVALGMAFAEDMGWQRKSPTSTKP